MRQVGKRGELGQPHIGHFTAAAQVQALQQCAAGKVRYACIRHLRASIFKASTTLSSGLLHCTML